MNGPTERERELLAENTLWRRVAEKADRESAGLRQRIDAIEALHHRYDDGFGLGDRCVNDGFLWPCSTALAAGVVDNPEEAP